MLRLKKIFVLIIWCFICSCNWVSCTSEKTSPTEELSEGMAKLTLLIPDYNGGAAFFNTRAFNTDEEGYMSNLYVIAIKYGNIDENGNVIEEFTEDNRKVYTYALNPVGEHISVGGDKYHTFNVTLYPGLYKFAVAANMDLYLWRTKKISEFTKEKELQDIVLYFSEDTPLAPLHLPMVCLPEDIIYEKEVSGATSAHPGWEKINGIELTMEPEVINNLVVINKKSDIAIHAKMKFLCAKVRYTILFDKTTGGISEAFGNSWIRFNVDDQLKPIATNLRRYTKLLPDGNAVVEGGENALFVKKVGSSGDASSDNSSGSIDGFTGSTYYTENGWWNMSIDRFQWHETEGANYPIKPTSTLKPWEGSTSDWIPQKQKVWQGVVYLPENMLDYRNDYKRTVLEFPYHTRDNDQDDTPEVQANEPKRIYLFGNPGEQNYEGIDNEGNYKDSPASEFKLERNYFYDVVAKVVNPDVDDMTIKVFVSIIPWHDIDQNIKNEDDLHYTGNGGSN